MAVQKCNSQLDTGLYLFILSECVYIHVSKLNGEMWLSYSTDWSKCSLETVFRDHLEDLFIGGRIILKWILNRLGFRGLDRCDVRVGTSNGLLNMAVSLRIPQSAGDFMTS